MVFLEFRPIQAPKRSYKLGVQWADAEVTRGREDGRGEQITDSELHNPSTGTVCAILGPREWLSSRGPASSKECQSVNCESATSRY
jgi:hypothetical protein